ncbi:MAG: cytochrome c3 family protein [Terriglobales bacterium]
MRNTQVQPEVGKSSSLCLSCHDGTVAVGQSLSAGKMRMSGVMTSIIGTRLEGSHPFSLQLPLKDAPHLIPGLSAGKNPRDLKKSVQFINGNIECTTCHNPHVQAADKDLPKFLVRENAYGALCLTCHDTTARTVSMQTNALAQWPTSIHAKSAAQVAPNAGLGNYSSVAEFACLSCHVSHNATGPQLLRTPVPPLPNMDSISQSCITCHDGSNRLIQPIANILADFQKIGHPLTTGKDAHSATEPAVLSESRHVTCADCHNAHASNQTTIFNQPPELRPSQNGVAGAGADGSALSGPATKQYENCLRCHGNSTAKGSVKSLGYLPARVVFAGDPYNLIPQFGSSATSSHPVMRDSTLVSQPSLRPFMWDLMGRTQMRSMGTRIFCTDCHNSDNNREFGGTGPNGPHGSKNDHILERPYTASQVAAGVWPTGGPGTPVVNLIPNPPLDPSSAGPYALCAKCHDLSNIMANTSFTKHSLHIQKGFSCSVCHTAHGVPAGTAGLSGKRLVNFDANVVAPNAGVLSYSNNTCILTCHMTDHNANGTVMQASTSRTSSTTIKTR